MGPNPVIYMLGRRSLYAFTITVPGTLSPMSPWWS